MIIIIVKCDYIIGKQVVFSFLSEMLVLGKTERLLNEHK